MVDPLLAVWEGTGSSSPHLYDPRSWGPDAADDLLARDGRSWIRGCGVHDDTDG